MKPFSLFVAGAATAAILAACGSGSSSSALSGLSPRQAAINALQKFQSTSLKYDLDGKISIDASKVQNAPPDVVNQITQALGGSNGLTISGTGEQESQQRVKVTVSLKPLVSETITGVQYDGTFYYSLDGGKTFGSGGSLSSLTSGFSITPDQSAKLFGGLPDSSFTEKGQTSIDGVTVEHYQATFTKDQLFQSIAGGSGSSSSAQQNLQLIEQFITIPSATVDSYIRTDNGAFDRYGANITLGFDLGKLVQALGGVGSGASGAAGTPSGTLFIGILANVHLHDYGASIHIDKPTVDPNAPKLPSGLGGLFGG